MLTLAVYLHNLSPIALKITDSIAIRWYGLSYLAGFLAGFFVVKFGVKRGITTMKNADVSDMVTWLAIGAVVGGRLGYCIFYKPSLFVEFVPLTLFGHKLPLWGALAIHQGGMSSHGGIIGVIAATAWYARKHGHTFSHLIDLAAIGTPLGLFFGRIANFVNGELLGRPCDPSFPLACKFPQEMHGWTRDQIENLAPATQFLKPEDNDPTRIVQACIDAMAKHDQRVIDIVVPLLTTRHPSQLYEAAMEGLLLFVVLIAVAWKPKKPLVVGATFCFVYAVVRIICEFFRLPDAHIADEEFGRWGITRGQLLSFFLAMLGLGLIFFAARRNLPKMGGLCAGLKPVEKVETPGKPVK
jgi:phosphatidylglycerol:prolipoprotein diacylglycerol transferase